MDQDYIWVSEAQFARLKPLLTTDTHGVPRVDDRRVISDIVYVLKSEGRWADAPPAYDPRKTLYNRFVRWAAKDVWADTFHALTDAFCRPIAFLVIGWPGGRLYRRGCPAGANARNVDPTWRQGL